MMLFLLWWDWALSMTRKTDPCLSLSTFSWGGKALWAHSRMATICHLPSSEPSLRTKSACTLIMHFPCSEMCDLRHSASISWLQKSEMTKILFFFYFLSCLIPDFKFTGLSNGREMVRGDFQVYLLVSKKILVCVGKHQWERPAQQCTCTLGVQLEHESRRGNVSVPCSNTGGFAPDAVLEHWTPASWIFGICPSSSPEIFRALCSDWRLSIRLHSTETWGCLEWVNVSQPL